MPQDKPHILILGAGLSGLTTAFILTKKGHKVTVIEARDRLGGRVYTKHLENNLHVEMGGEWIGKEHFTILNLCKELGLEVLDHGFSDPGLVLKNKYYKGEEWLLSNEALNKIEKYTSHLNTLSNDSLEKLDKISFKEFLIHEGFSKTEIELLNIVESVEFGAFIDNISCLRALRDYIKPGTSQKNDLKIKGGNDLLLNALANEIGSHNIFLNSPVIQVFQSDRGVRVITKDKREIQGSLLVCSLPASVVSDIYWSPHFPPSKIESLKKLKYSNVLKTVFVFEERFWKNNSFAVYTDSYLQHIYHSTKNQDGKSGILTSYTVDKNAELFYKIHEHEKIVRFEDVLRPIFNNTIELVSDVIEKNWVVDAYSKGAFAYYGSGQWYALKKVLKESFGKVYFCGEHVAENQGYMEGAVESGYTMAKELFDIVR